MILKRSNNFSNPVETVSKRRKFATTWAEQLLSVSIIAVINSYRGSNTIYTCVSMSLICILDNFIYVNDSR